MSRTQFVEPVWQDPALVVDDKPPLKCKRCEILMWLTTLTRTVTDYATIERRDYECKSCGSCDCIEAAKPFAKEGLFRKT